MQQKRRTSHNTESQIVSYFKIVLLVSFAFGFIAVVITGSPRIAFGTIVLGIFFGYLLYCAYNQ